MKGNRIVRVWNPLHKVIKEVAEENALIISDVVSILVLASSSSEKLSNLFQVIYGLTPQEAEKVAKEIHSKMGMVLNEILRSENQPLWIGKYRLARLRPVKHV